MNLHKSRLRTVTTVLGHVWLNTVAPMALFFPKYLTGIDCGNQKQISHTTNYIVDATIECPSDL
jgi:hypothetical protein